MATLQGREFLMKSRIALAAAALIGFAGTAVAADTTKIACWTLWAKMAGSNEVKAGGVSIMII